MAVRVRAGITLPEMLAAASVIYAGEFRPVLALKALAYFGDPGLGDLPRTVRDDLAAAVKSVNPARLPIVKPIRPRPERP